MPSPKLHITYPPENWSHYQFHVGVPQFISRVWKAFFKLLNVIVSLSSGYNPQTKGQTERKIQEIGRHLRAYCHDNQRSWNRFLPWAEYAQNSLKQTTTGLTPFQCTLGYQPPLFPWTEEPSDIPAVDHWFRVSKRVWDSAHVQLQQAVRRHKTYADACRSSTPIYHPGPDEPAVPPPPKVMEEPLVYRVQDILDSRRWGGRLEYLIDWEGYRPEERSWVAQDDVLDPSLLVNFHQNHTDRPAPRGRGRPRHHNRASGAAPGGGGTVRESPQSPQSPPTTLTRSQSPDY